MATAILDLHIEALPRDLTGLEAYQHALALIRYRGRAVGKILLPVDGGRISGQQVSRALLEMDLNPLWRAWVCDFTGDDPGGAGPFPAITVAVCTRDRPDDLKNCLEGILRLPDDGQEILVVDNHPRTDATLELARQYPRVRYVREERPGLDAARNRALREARTDIVAFIDDDAAPDTNWLRALARNFADPQILAVTGLTMPSELETEAQEIFERYSGFARGFTRTVFSLQNTNPLAASRVGAGANMALRRELVDLVGPFDEALDAGTPTQSGGDTEMFSRILRAGYQVVYEPDALNWHRHRRTWPELRRVLYGYGVGIYATWARQLIYEGEVGVIRISVSWFWKYQLPGLLKAVLRPARSPVPAALLLDELRGCLAGPGAYLRARRDRQGAA